MCLKKLQKRLNELLMHVQKNKGFTIIELLVALAIIGLLGTAAGVMVSSAREKVRDYKRMNDMTEIQAALEDYFNENNQYPDGSLLALGDITTSACLSSEGFKSSCSGDSVVFMSIVPALYSGGLKDLVVCGDPQRSSYCYSQLSDGATYAIHVEFERNIPERGIAKGVNCASPSGLFGGVCSE